MKSEFRLGVDGVYRCEALTGFNFADHGFGSKLGNPQVDVTLRQIHSDIVRNADGLRDREEEGDALVSRVAGLRIGVRTADCVPILLLDPQTHAVAAVHAGWRGTAAEVVSKTTQRLGSDFGCNPQDLHAAIGPCIRECCYQVGAEVARQFTPFFPEWTGEVEQRNLDLIEANVRQMTAAGLSSSHVFDSELCTACSTDRLFSYRREPENPGRMIASISRLI